MSKSKIKNKSRKPRDERTPEPENEVEVEAKWRDSIEQLVVAVILALLFRAFEAEAFVIPTGSMAPTLMGRHKDADCEKCGYPVRAGANLESEMTSGAVVAATCPICRYQNDVSPLKHPSYSGDRILVNKFAYQFGDPRRWDVIVFKYPGNPKQNYIKRLIGLPNETIKIYHGDIYVKGTEEPQFTIARKPPKKIERLLQVVHDTKYVGPELVAADWPSSWFGNEWNVSDNQQSYSLAATSRLSWLRYRHIPPTADEWRSIETGALAVTPDRFQGELITDFCSYNAYRNLRGGVTRGRLQGWHWVGDLAAEYEVQVDGEQGELALDVVEAGRHYTCRIDVADGTAKLTIDDGGATFSDGASELTANTKVKGAGRYRLRLSNLDDQIVFWVNGKPVQFLLQGAKHAATYDPPPTVKPQWSATDPGDLNPVRIGAKGVAITVERAIVSRDLYYVATDNPHGETLDYDVPPDGFGGVFENEILRDFHNPGLWQTSRVFAARRFVEFELNDNQFFPMGDNSRASKDARIWHGRQPSTFAPSNYVDVEPYVERQRLIGKAFLVYWPHPWYYLVPNVERMGRIR